MLKTLGCNELLCAHRGVIKEDMQRYLEYLKDHEIKVADEAL
jgi:hypothetical protein